MSLSLGTLEIGLGLNTAQYDSGIKSAKDKLSSLERRVDEISSTAMKIKVGVDDSQLYKLNDHLNIKTSHLEEVVNFYKANPIKVFVDDESLDILNQKLDNLSKQDINLSSSSGEQIGQQLFDGIEKALSDLGNVVSAPLKSVFTGVFEGIGNEISKNFTRNAINSFTSSMGIPSLGDLGNISGEEIGVSFGGKRKSTKKSTKKKNNRQDGDFLETLIDTGFDIAVDAIPVNNSKLKKLIKTVLQREIDNAVSSARNETAKVSSNNNVASSVNKASQDIVTAVKRVEDAVRGGNNTLIDPWSDTQTKDMWGGEPDIVKRQRKEIDRALQQKSLPPSPDRLNRISNTPSPSFFQEKVKDLAVTAKSRLEDVLVSRLGTPDKSGTIQHLSGNENFAELLQLTLVKELKTAGLLLSKAFQDTSLDVVKFGQVVYAVMQALERPVMALPGAAMGKKAIQVGGTAAMGAAAIHALPGGLDTAVVESMRTILSEALSAGGTQMLHAVQAQMTSVFNGLPFGIGQQLTTAVMQLVTELTSGTINVLASGGAIAGSSLAAGEGVKKLLGVATSNVPKLVSTEEQQRIEGKTQKALKAAKSKADSLITTEITPYFDEKVFPVSNPIPANIKAINPEYYTVKQLRGLARDQGINVPASGVGSKKEEIWKSLTERFNPDQLTRLLLTTKASDRTKLGKKELSGVQIPTTEIPADFTKRIGIGIKNIGQEINTTKDIQSLERLYFQLEKVKKGITALRANPEFNTTSINKSLSGFLQSVDNLQTQILAKGGLESGKDYQQGLKLGLSDNSAQKIAYQNALKIVDATDKGLGNASPSKKGKKSGEDYIKGVEIGAENQSKSLFRKVSDIGKKTAEILTTDITKLGKNKEAPLPNEVQEIVDYFAESKPSEEELYKKGQIRDFSASIPEFKGHKDKNILSDVLLKEYVNLPLDQDFAANYQTIKTDINKAQTIKNSQQREEFLQKTLSHLPFYTEEEKQNRKGSIKGSLSLANITEPLDFYEDQFPRKAERLGEKAQFDSDYFERIKYYEQEFPEQSSKRFAFSRNASFVEGRGKARSAEIEYYKQEIKVLLEAINQAEKQIAIQDIEKGQFSIDKTYSRHNQDLDSRGSLGFDLAHREDVINKVVDEMLTNRRWSNKKDKENYDYATIKGYFAVGDDFDEQLGFYSIAEKLASETSKIKDPSKLKKLVTKEMESFPVIERQPFLDKTQKEYAYRKDYDGKDFSEGITNTEADLLADRIRKLKRIVQSMVKKIDEIYLEAGQDYQKLLEVGFTENEARDISIGKPVKGAISADVEVITEESFDGKKLGSIPETQKSLEKIIDVYAETVKEAEQKALPPSIASAVNFDAIPSPRIKETVEVYTETVQPIDQKITQPSVSFDSVVKPEKLFKEDTQSQEENISKASKLSKAFSITQLPRVAPPNNSIIPEVIIDKEIKKVSKKPEGIVIDVYAETVKEFEQKALLSATNLSVPNLSEITNKSVIDVQNIPVNSKISNKNLKEKLERIGEIRKNVDRTIKEPQEIIKPVETSKQKKLDQKLPASDSGKIYTKPFKIIEEQPSLYTPSSIVEKKVQALKEPGLSTAEIEKMLFDEVEISTTQKAPDELLSDELSKKDAERTRKHKAEKEAWAKLWTNHEAQKKASTQQLVPVIASAETLGNNKIKTEKTEEKLPLYTPSSIVEKKGQALKEPGLSTAEIEKMLAESAKKSEELFLKEMTKRSAKKAEEIYAETIKESEQKALPPVNKLATEPSLKKSLTVQEYSRSLYGYLGQQVKKAEKSIEQKNAQKNLSSNEPVKVQINQPKETKPSNEPVKVKIVSSSDSGSGQPPKPPKPPTISSQPSPDDDNNKSSGQKVKVKAVSNISKEATQNTSEQVKNETKQTTRTFLEKIFGKPGDDFRRRREEVNRRREADPTSVSYWDEFFRKLINKAGSKIYPEGTASERRTVLGEVTSTGVAMATAFAPISTAQIATLFPLVLPAIPAIISSLGVFNMLSPAFQGGADRITQTETINSRLNALTGNPDLSGKEYEYLKELADKYRVSLQSLSEGYTQLAIAARGTKLEGDPVKDLFEGITASVKALRLNTADTSLVLNAYTQILSKGKVSMEELRQQLGEKFPPAMQVFSKALGLSTAEFNTLVSKGAILSEDILPKVGKILKSDFGSSALAFSNDFTSSLAALETAGFEFSRKFAETFSPAYAAITNLGANTLRIVSDNFRTVLELATALSIGVAAQIAVGLQQMLIVPAIATKLAPVQAAILSTWKTVLTGISPFIVGTFADILSYALGADQSIFQNITSGIKNAVELGIKAVDAAKVNLTGISFFDPGWSKIGIPDKEVQGLTGMLLKIPKAFGDAGSALVNFFKTIPSGVVELAALVLTFEQLSALYKLYLVPMGTGLKATFIELGKAIHQAFLSNNAFLGHLRALFPASGTLAEKFVFMRQQILGFATTTSLASASLNVLKAASLAFIGVASKLALPLAFLSFANGDFTNQLMDDFRKFENNAISNIENIQKALDGLTAPKLKIEIDSPTGLPSKGIELNPLKTLNLSDKSYKSDDLTKSINRDPALAGFIKFVSNPISPDLANKEVKDAKKQANALGIGNYFSDNQEFLTQSQTNLLSTAQKYKQFGENLNNSSLGKVGLSDPRNVGKFIDTTRPVVNDLKIIDDTIQRLSKQRIALGLENTTNARNEIKKIDDQIGILLKKRKDTAKPLQEVMDFDSIRIGLQEQIKQIDESDYPEQAKRSLKALLQPTLDNLNKVKSEIDKAGISTILEPLESIWQSTIDRLSDAEKTFNKILNKIEIRTSGRQLDLYTKNLDPAAVQESQAKIDISKQKQTVASLQTILQERQSALSDLLSIPNVENNESRKQEINDLREKVTDSEKELASARLSLAKSEYDATQDRLRKQQSETKLRVDSEIARKRIDVIRANPFGGVNASLKNAEIDVEERIQAIGLLYQQLADNTGNPIEVKSQIVAAELALEQARANLLQQQTSLQDYYRNLDRQIIDFNRQIEDYRRQIEDTQLSTFKENRSLSESYSDLVRELDKNLLNAQNQLLDTTDRIRVQQVKNRLLIPGTSDAGKELGDIFLEFVQGQADLASRGRTFQSRTEEIETSYISTLRNIRNLQEQQQDAERNRLRTIEDIKRTQENLNRTLADLIRQTNKELGFIPQSIKDIVTNLNTLPEPIKLINSELVAIPPNIKTSGEDLVKSIEETAEAIRKAKEGLILPAPSNFIPAPVWNGGSFLPPPPSQSPSQNSGNSDLETRLTRLLNKHNSPLTAKDFIDASQKTGVSVDALVTQALIESHFGTKGRAAKTRNPLNYGNDDAGNNKFFSTFREGLIYAAQKLKEDFFFTTPEDFMSRNFKGRYGIYATDPLYGQKYRSALNNVRNELGTTQPSNQPRTQAELEALQYNGNPANSEALNRVQQIRRNQGGQGGPEFSSLPPIAQIPTLPNQNQDNFWDADLPPVPKENPINFQNPNLPPVPNLPSGNIGKAADQIRAAETANQNADEFLRQLESSFLTETTLDRIIKFGRQQEEEARDLNRTIRDASESVTDLTINSKGYLTVQEEINKSATEVSRQYRSQIESLQDQRRNLEYQADGWQKMSENIKKGVAEQIALEQIPADVAEQLLKNADALAERVKSAKEQVGILDQAIEQLGRNQGVATLEASFRKTRDTVRSIRDRLNDLTIQRLKLENQSRPTLFDDSAILAERISLQKDKEELEDYLEPYKDLPQYAEYVANIRSEWEKLAELRLERVALDASPNRGASESFFSDIREGKGIGSAFSSLGLNIATKFVEGITKPAIDALTLAIDGFTKPITQAFESVFNTIIGPVGNFFTNALSSIFKPVGNTFSSIFGGSGSGGLFNGLLSGITGIFSGGLGGLGSIGSLGSIGASGFASAPASSYSLGTGFKLFSDGGKVGDANAPIEKNIISAFQRERAMSGGRKPRLIVANEDELVLNPKETEAYLEYRNNAPIKNYANGGFVGGKPNYSTTSNNNNSNQSLVINNTNNVTVESRNDMGYSLTQLKERENAQNERTKKRFFS